LVNEWGKNGRKGSFDQGSTEYVEVDRPVAYKEVLKTWAKWVDRNIDPNRTTVFFMGMSPNHITYVVVSHVFIYLFSSALAIGLSVYLHFNFLRNASTLH
jgi:hypothetical protein